MSNITKLALSQTNTRLAAENADLRAQVAQLQADLARVTEVASALNTMQRGDKPARAAYVKPQWQINREAAMAQAKALAIATGNVVRV